MTRVAASGTCILGFVAFIATAVTGCEGERSGPSGSQQQALVLGCAQHSQCEDDDPCTQNLCAAGLCAPPLPILGCCFEGDCTGAGGDGGGGAPTSTVGLDCDQDAKCEDDNPCTQNLCAVGLCVALPVVGCCFLGQCVDDGEGGSGGQAGEIGAGGNHEPAGGAGTGQGGTNGQGGSGIAHAGESQLGSGGGDDGEGGRATGGSGAPSSQAGTDGSAASAGDEGRAGGAAASTEWIMEGGGCSLSRPRSDGSQLLLLVALGAVLARQRRRKRLAALALAAPLSLTAQASAAGFAQDAYTAPVAPEDLMWTERAGSDSGHVRPFARLTLGFTDDPLVLVDANDSNREIRVVDDQFGLYGAFGVGLFHRAHVALAMPLYVQSSAVASAGDVKGARPGDIGLDARFAIFERLSPVELALAGTLRLPSGARAAYASDGAANVWLRALLSKQLGADGSLVNVSFGPALRPAHEEAGVAIGSQVRFSAGALLALSRVLGVTAELAGSTPTDDPFAGNGTPVEGALGGRLTLSQVVLGTSLGTGLSSGVGAPDWRWLAMLSVPAGCLDDHRAPPPKSQAPDVDADRDGVPVPADLCPNEAEDEDGFEDGDGCPDSDNDRDGVSDGKDRCADDAEDKDGFEDGDGCPDSDNDRDGVVEPTDQCPDKPEDLDRWQDEDGCPEDDNDQDGLLDAQDKCPNEPESKNGVDDDDGCPDLIRVEAGQIRTLEPVYFDYNKASIQARSESMLGEMAALIKSRPDLGTIAIEGHTDAKGSAAYNLKLSRDRAAAVRAFLVRAGVAEERLTSDGFGSTKPIDDNKTEPGRAKNRRVEFHFSL
jgi:outer membrane protein OmpA-like peptidoglycan-associated protein